MLFDYEPVTSDELCLRVGENVEVRVGGDDDWEEGWLYGTDLRGRHGIFPANYVADLRSRAGDDTYDSPDGNLGGGSSAAYHGPGDAEHAGGSSASSAAYGQANHGRGQACREGLVQAAGKGRDGPAAAPHYRVQDAAASAYHAGEQQDGGHGATDATTTHYLNEDARTGASRASQQQEPVSTCNAHAPEEEGAASDQLPDGWLCATDPDSGVMYYYTADGQSSWTRPTSTVVAGAPEPLPGNGEGNPAAAGGGQGSGVSACLCEVLRCFARVLGVRTTWEVVYMVEARAPRLFSLFFLLVLSSG